MAKIPACHVANEFLRCRARGDSYFKAGGPVHPCCSQGLHGYFYRDLDLFDEAFCRLDAIITIGDFTGIDESKVPSDLLGAYRGLTQYGYANGLL